MTVKDKIIDLRIRSGLTQEQFAEKANVDLEQLKAVENGERLPDEDMRVVISQAFELSAYELTPDIDEQDEYDKQSEAENTIDTQLPYNPFFREGSEGNVGAALQPVAANSRKILRRAGIETYFCTGILVTFLFAIPNYLSIILTKAGRHDLTAGIYAHTNLLASVMSALGTVISFLLIRYIYLKAFRRLGKEEISKKNVWFALVSVYFVSGMTDYALNLLISKPSPINNEAVRDNFGMFLARFLILSVGIVLTAVVTVSVFYLLYRLFDESPAVENENRFFVPYLIIAAVSVFRIVLAFVIGSPPNVFSLFRLVIEIITVVLVAVIAKDKQKMNSRFLTNILPIIFIAVYMLTKIIP